MCEPVTLSFPLPEAYPDIQLAAVLNDAVKHFTRGECPASLSPQEVAAVVDWLHTKYGSKPAVIDVRRALRSLTHDR